MGILEWLDAYAGAIQAIATVLLAVITLGYVLLTGRLVRDNSAQLKVLRDRDARDDEHIRTELRALAARLPRYLEPLIAADGDPKAIRRNDVWGAAAAGRVEQLSTRIPGLWALGSEAAMHLHGLHDTIRRVQAARNAVALGHYSREEFAEQATAARDALRAIAERLDNATPPD